MLCRLSRHPSLSSIIPGRSWRLHPVSAQSSCIQVLAGHPAFARPCEGVHRSMLFMSLSLLLQQCPTCLVHLTWIVFIMGLGGHTATALWGAAYGLPKETVTAITMCYNQDSLTRWRQTSLTLLLVFCKGDILAPISVHNLPRLWASNIDNGRKWLYNKKAGSRQYPAQTIMNTDYTDKTALLANTTTQPESHNLKQAAGGIGLHVNADKTEYMCFNQKRDISTNWQFSEINRQIHVPQ